MNFNDPQEKVGFSPVVGGPLYEFFRRIRLLRPPIELVHRRIVVLVLATWLPLAVLTALAGSFFGGVRVPFFFDLNVHIRLLVWLPLIIVAELILHRRLPPAVSQFTDRGLVLVEDQPRFEAAISRAARLRDSTAVEVVLLILAITTGFELWRSQVALSGTTWYGSSEKGSTQLTWAGYWYVFVSLSIARFLLARWLFRLCVWYVFMWRVSQLKLRLNPLHPDRAGGLGFLAITIEALTPFLFAQSAFLAGVIANRIWHEGSKLPSFQFDIIASEAVLVVLALLPLTFFFWRLMEAKREAILEYGQLASRYAGEFRQKWLAGRAAPDEPLLGSADIQSLADLANSFEVVQKTRPLPFDTRQVIRLIFLTGLPLLPLLLTMIPLVEIISRVLKLLM